MEDDVGVTGRCVGYVRASEAALVGFIQALLQKHATNLHDTMATASTNSVASHAPIEISVPLPLAPRTDINIRLHDNGPNITLFLTTTTPDAASSVPLGSLVYAMPNVRVIVYSQPRFTVD